jgi:DNA-binding transcriptional MocR family regulator
MSKAVSAAPTPLLSAYGEASSRPAPVARLMAEFAHDFRDGIDINLGVGYVNEETIPAGYFQEAMHAVAADPIKYRQAFNYGGPHGSPNLIESLRRFIGEPNVGGKSLAIGPCGATSILDALTDLFEPGVVVTSDPMYYIYINVLERKGFDVLAVPEDLDGINLDALERKLERAGRIAFLYTVTVNNPSCTILSNARRRALLRVAQRLSVPIFFDLGYQLLLHDPDAAPFESVLPEDDSGLAYEIGTLSKVIAPALRIGYILGPGGPLMNAMIQRTSDAGFSAPLFVQEMASWLLDHRIEEQLKNVNAGYREKAVAVREGIERNLGPYLEEVRGGSAGFYFYLTFKGLETHPRSQFFQRLAAGDPHVVYIPGEYCVHPKGDLAERGRRQLRISYAFESTGQIVKALELMKHAAARC